MIRLTLDQVADVVGGELVDAADGAAEIDDVTVDSRTARPGSLFVPLPGEHVDGHDYIADAARRGATGYLRAARRHGGVGPAGGIVVDDPADALLGLGAWVRDRVAPTVVAITGSSGKTTTKDFVAAAVGATKDVVASPGSYNNEIGVPLTCCRLTARTDVLVAEIGARGVGHIARLVPLVRPDVAIVTTVGASHLATLGDVDTVARAKTELVEGLTADGVAVLNADDSRVAAMADATPARAVTYAVHADGDWRAVDVTFDELARPAFTAAGPEGQRARVELPVPGEHTIGNALAALAAADAAGVAVDEAAPALAAATVSQWRMQLLRTPGGVDILNDAYNANPASTAAALRTLARMGSGGRRWAVLGEMAELGVAAEQAHATVGRLAAELGIDGLMAVGEPAWAIRTGAQDAGFRGDVLAVDSPDEAAAALVERLGPGDAVLVKASRAVGLERLAESLQTAGGEAGA